MKVIHQGILSSAVITLLLFALPGCKDACAGVECVPAPPLLEVVVLDSLRLDTTLVFTLTNPDTTYSVDTTLYVQRATSAARVTLQTVTDKDTTTVDTLAPSGTSYYENVLAKIPSGKFLARAERGGRVILQDNLLLQQIDGCCAYPVVGRYVMTLPQ